MWERSFRRAKLPLKYSQGFHPQPKIQQANPLPLGFLSKNEMVDFYLEEEIKVEDLLSRFPQVLPAGIQINSIEQVDNNEPTLQKLAEASEYLVYFLDKMDLNSTRKSIEDVLEKDTVLRVRRGKSYDLRPLIISLELQIVENGILKMVLSAKDGATGRPDEVLDELGIPLENTRIVRQKTILMEKPSLNSAENEK
jgi:radical SAM-linked protein